MQTKEELEGGITRTVWRAMSMPAILIVVMVSWCTHRSKCTKSYSLNIHSLLRVSHTSIKP